MNAQRTAYLISRTLGDYEAAKRGRLIQRVVKRAIHRREIGLLRRLKLW